MTADLVASVVLMDGVGAVSPERGFLSFGVTNGMPLTDSATSIDFTCASA